MFLRNFKSTFPKVNIVFQVRKCSVILEKNIVEEKAEIDEEKIQKEERIARLRDVSRLPSKLKGRMKHVLEPHPHEIQINYIAQLKRKKYFNNVLYATYGRKSGIDPSYFWMNKEQLKEQVEFEEEFEPSLDTKLQALKEQEESERQEIQEKDELMASQMKKMPGFIKEFQGKLLKDSEKELDMQKKKQVLLDEAREFFGYNISPLDPRFEQMKLQKEEEERKGKKLLKKKKNQEFS